MIDLVTEDLLQIKTAGQPKIYAEMMTIQLSELHAASAPADLPENLVGQLSQLQAEISELKKEIASLSNGFVPASAKPVQAKSKSGFKFKVDRLKVLTIMEETVVDSQKSREYLDALKGAWNEILDSISAQDRALLLGSEPVLANSENAILAFDAAFNAEQAMKRSDLNDVFGNIMSKAAGFSPNIIAVPRKDFNSIRSEFAQKMKTQKQENVPEENTDKHFIPDGFNFLADKIQTVED